MGKISARTPKTDLDTADEFAIGIPGNPKWSPKQLAADLLNQANAELSSGSTLTSDAFKNFYKLTGASHSTELPTAVGNEGRIVRFCVPITEVGTYTIDGNGSETIDGTTTKDMIAGDFMFARSDGVNWRMLITPSSLSSNVGAIDFIAEHQEASGVNGGSVATAWNNGFANTEVYDPNGYLTLGAGSFTLLDGTYLIRYWQTFYNFSGGNWHGQARLFEIVGATELSVGLCTQIGVNGGWTSSGSAVITVTPGQLYSVQHRASAAVASVGLGDGNHFGTNVFQRIEGVRLG